MTSPETTLGTLLASHPAKGGFTGFQNRGPGRTALLTLAGAALGFTPGLLVALFTDLWPALIVGPILGAIGAFLWARTLNFDAAVTEGRVYEGGLVLVDARGSHVLGWGDVALIEGRHTQHVLGTGMGNIKGVTEHTYVVRARDGSGYWLDDRITDVVALVTAISQRSGVAVTPMG